MKKVPSFLLRRLLNCGRVPIFALQSRTKASQIGRLAQLVQSVCLTSRGSGVRIPQRPHSFRQLSIGRWIAVFLCTKETESGVGDTRKFGGRLCAKPVSAGCAVVCFAWNVGRRCSFHCERVCAVAVCIWCHLLEKLIDGWRCSLKKAERKIEKTGEVEHFSPAFYPTFRTTAYSSLWLTRSSGKGGERAPEGMKRNVFLCARVGFFGMQLCSFVGCGESEELKCAADE